MTITLKDVGSGFKRTAINENFDTIESELNNNVLRRDGVDGANQLEVDIDMNSQRLLNLVDAINGREPVTLDQLNGALSTASSGLIAAQQEQQTGAQVVGSVTTFTGITYTVSSNNLYVFRNGNYQTKGVDYNETSTSSITWTTVPNATDALVFITNLSTTNSVSDTSAISHTQSGTDYNLASYLQAEGTFTLSQAVANTSLYEGAVVTISDRGYGVFDAVLASSVTPNTYNIVQCTGVPALALVLRPSRPINVAEYGASPSATGTANSSAFNAAIASGESVFVPAGQWELSEPVQIKFDGQALFGDGTYNTTLLWTGTDNTKNMIELWTGRRDLLDDGLATTNSRFSNFKISTKTGSSIQNLIWVEAGCFHGWIEKIRGFDIRGSVPTEAILKFDSNGGQSYPVGMNVRDVVLTGGLNDDLVPVPIGIWIEGAIEPFFESVKVFTTQVGWQFGTPTSSDIRGVVNGSFIHCHSEIGDRGFADENGRAMLFYQARDLRFYGCKIYAGADFSGATTQLPLRFLGVDTSQNKAVTFRDCTIWGSGTCANAMSFSSDTNYQVVKFLSTEFYQFTSALVVTSGDDVPTMYIDENCTFVGCEATTPNFDLESIDISEFTVTNASAATINLQAGNDTTQVKRGEAILLGHTDDTQGLMISAYKATSDVVQVRGYNRTGGGVTIPDGYFYTRGIGRHNSENMATKPYNPPSLLSASSTSTTVTVPGVQLGDTVAANFDMDMEDVNLFAYVSAPDEVAVYFVNRTSSTRDLDSGSLRVYLVKSILDYYGSATYDAPSLAANAGVTTTLSVSGASLGDIAMFSMDTDLLGVVGYAWVSATGTVSVRFQNESGGVVDLPSATLLAGVIERPTSL